VAQRISIFVKNDLFRRIKFVNSQQSFAKAFQKVNEVERPKHPYVFQLTYGKCFTFALNQKRSTCEQAGKQIAILFFLQRLRNSVTSCSDYKCKPPNQHPQEQASGKVMSRTFVSLCASLMTM
jgi:hypothetical protein